MPNTYFQFKQFRIEQANCAMKVSTDACLQGAWTPLRSEIKKVLDIGAGTGLLSLMLAQRHPSISIDALEIDTAAAQQAKENFEASPWSDRLRLIHIDAKNYCAPHRYDLIICNPPFFNNSLLGDHTARNHARHTLLYTYDDLLQSITQHLSDEGYASVLLPWQAGRETWHRCAKKQGIFIQQELHITPRINAAPNRLIAICTTQSKGNYEETTLNIRKEENQYTQAFKDLMAPFYLAI